MIRFTYACSLLITLTLLAGSLLAPQSFVMSFVSASSSIIAVRVVLAVLLMGLIATNPPRSLAFRAVLGAASLAFFGWAIGYALNGSIRVADSILFLHAAISFALAGLEYGRYPHAEADAALLGLQRPG